MKGLDPAPMLHLLIYFFKVGRFACGCLSCRLTKPVPTSTFNTWPPRHPHRPPVRLYRASLFISFPACRRFVSCLTVRTTSLHFACILTFDLSDFLPGLFLLRTTRSCKILQFCMYQMSAPRGRHQGSGIQRAGSTKEESTPTLATSTG